MPDPEGGGQAFEVICSAAIAGALRQLQREASRAGHGEELAAAFRYIVERLRVDPNDVGEPLYRLPALRLLVRTVVHRPLVVDFAVYEERPLVFIKGVQRLAPESRK